MKRFPSPPYPRLSESWAVSCSSFCSCAEWDIIPRKWRNFTRPRPEAFPNRPASFRLPSLFPVHSSPWPRVAEVVTELRHSESFLPLPILLPNNVDVERPSAIILSLRNNVSIIPQPCRPYGPAPSPERATSSVLKVLPSTVVQAVFCFAGMCLSLSSQSIYPQEHDYVSRCHRTAYLSGIPGAFRRSRPLRGTSQQVIRVMA